MALLPKGSEIKYGLAPGALVPVGERKVEESTISIMEFDAAGLQETVVERPKDCLPFSDTPKATWINVEGIRDIDLLREFGEVFGLNPLILEDVLNTNQRPKVEDFGNYLFVVMKILLFDEEAGKVEVEQISVILGKNFVLTFREKMRGILEPLRKRIRDPRGGIRRRSVDYLFYAIIDVIIDYYFVVLEKIGDRIEELEDQVILNPDPDLLKRIFEAKVNMLVIRRATWPLRDLTNELTRGESPLLGENIGHFLRDLYDHTVQLIETVEVTREMAQSMADLYLSVVNNRMNEVMKVLTVIASIFIPLTFLAGIYGMNFKFIPELDWRWGYFAVWGAMVAIGVSMLIFFKRKKWL
ncbi:MAG: magnesium/cobalt transporter CorA [bacterium]